MTPSAVAKLIAKWRELASPKSAGPLNGIQQLTLLGCADALEAALATAPPEQAQKEGATMSGKFIPPPKQQSGEHRADSKRTSADPPQPASAGALDAVAIHDESFQLVDKWFVSKCDKAEIPTILLNWKQTMDSLRPLVAAALASHDQKVREPLATWMIANSFATGHGDTVEDLLKELKWQIEERVQKVRREMLEEAALLVEKAFEQSWVVQDTLDAIRSLAAPAASKPEADK